MSQQRVSDRELRSFIDQNECCLSGVEYKIGADLRDARAALAKRDAEIARVKDENARLSAQALESWRQAREAQNDATMWQYSIADGAHPPLLVAAHERAKRAEAELAALRAAPTDAQHEQAVATVRAFVRTHDPIPSTELLAALDRLAARPSRDAVLEEAAVWLETNYPLLMYRAKEMRSALKSPPTLQPAKEA